MDNDLNSSLARMQREGTADMPLATPIRAPTGPASAGTVHVYYRSGDDTLFLATSNNKPQLVYFSRTAHDQLMKANFEANMMVYIENVHQVIVDEVDDVSGQIVINWITSNNMYNPQPLTIAHLGMNNSFLDGCKLHHACHVFHLNRDLRGEDIRQRIFWHIRSSPQVDIEDFKIVLEWLKFDVGLVKEMMRKVAYKTLYGWIPDDEREQMMSYCVEYDQTKGTKLVEQMAKVEAEVKASIRAGAARRAREAGHAQSANEFLIPVHGSAADRVGAISPASDQGGAITPAAD